MISYNAIRKNKTLLQVLQVLPAAVAVEDDLKKKTEAKENDD